MSYRNVRVPKCHGPRVLTGYTLNGYEVVILENELLRVVINVGRGAAIPEFQYKPADLDVMYKTFGGMRHHSDFTLSDYNVRPLFDYHPEGWFECFPSGSAGVKQAGAEIGFHGEVWGLPFEIGAVQEDAGQCAVTLTAFTMRSPWKLVKTFALRQNDPTLYLEETATNLATQELGVMWGQHPLFGAPFVDGKCYIELPGNTVVQDWTNLASGGKWPVDDLGVDRSKVCAQESHSSKMLFITDLRQGQYRLCSPTWKLAFELQWNKDDFPWCWYYENAGVEDYPGWGKGYGVALEPFTGLPKAIERDQGVIKIAGGQSKTVNFEARVVAI